MENGTCLNRKTTALSSQILSLSIASICFCTNQPFFLQKAKLFIHFKGIFIWVWSVSLAVNNFGNKNHASVVLVPVLKSLSYSRDFDPFYLLLTICGIQKVAFASLTSHHTKHMFQLTIYVESLLIEIK